MKLPRQAEGESAEPGRAPLLKLKFTNDVHIDVDHLIEILSRYEDDRAGFFAKIPRVR
jgi:hypothetical protein